MHFSLEAVHQQLELERDAEIEREKQSSFVSAASSCQNQKSPTRTLIPIQSPTISNSERTTYRGSRKIEKGERERKRVADIRNKVDVLRKRIDPEFMKGYSSKKPTRLQTLKTAICYICSLSKFLQGDIWECRCEPMGMEHRQITRGGRAGLALPVPSRNVTRTSLQSYENPHSNILHRGIPPSLAYGHVHFK